MAPSITPATDRKMSRITTPKGKPDVSSVQDLAIPNLITGLDISANINPYGKSNVRLKGSLS